MGISRIVLDTNVCLDLFVFRDPRWHVILQQLQNGEIQAVTRHDCRDEWLAVLFYPHLPIDENNRAGFIAVFDRYVKVLAPDERCITLPKCKDSDDQKFMEIARDSEAVILLTKDKALLKLSKKVSKANLFQIMTPESYLSLGN